MADELGEVEVGLEVDQLPGDAAQPAVVVRGPLEELELAGELLELGVDEGELVLQPGGGLLLALLPVGVHLVLHVRQQVLLVLEVAQDILHNKIHFITLYNTFNLLLGVTNVQIHLKFLDFHFSKPHP